MAQRPPITHPYRKAKTVLTAAFWKGATERAIKTAAQSLLAVLGVTGIGFGDVDWTASLSVAGVAALASVLTSIVNPGFTSGVPGGVAPVEDGDYIVGEDEPDYTGDPEQVETEADRDPVAAAAAEEDDTPVDDDYTPRHSA
jgi:hypothetical protein